MEQNFTHSIESTVLTRQEQLAALMRSTGRTIIHCNGKRPSQGRILHLLSKNGSMTQQELQNNLDIQSGSVSEILTKMEALGLIARERHSSDKRKVVVTITPKGQTDLEEHKLMRLRRQAILYDCLEPDEQEELIRLLTKLRDSWKTLPPAFAASNPDKGGTPS